MSQKRKSFVSTTFRRDTLGIACLLASFFGAADVSGMERTNQTWITLVTLGSRLVRMLNIVKPCFTHKEISWNFKIWCLGKANWPKRQLDHHGSNCHEDSQKKGRMTPRQPATPLGTNGWSWGITKLPFYQWNQVTGKFRTEPYWTPVEPLLLYKNPQELA